MSKLILQANNIKKQYSGVNVLNDVNCKVYSSKITFLVGPSGGGKSTFLKCLTGIENLDMGEVIFENELIANKNLNLFDKFYPQITAVSQGYSLWPHLTNIQNITLSRHIMDVKVIKNYAKRFKVLDLLNKYPYECSGGEMQRIALIRHIALRPKILFLDEITSALDVEQIQVLEDILIELKNEGMSIFIITHSLSLVTKIGDYFIFMDEGKIIEHGDSRDFLYPTNERFKLFLKAYGI